MDEVESKELVIVPFKVLMYAMVDVENGELVRVEIPGDSFERANNEVFNELGEEVNTKTAADAEEIAWNGDWATQNLHWV
jgi:hypothetical protein